MERQKFGGIAWGAVLTLAVFLAACSPSPKQELSHLRAQLISLQKSSPDDFLQQEIATIEASLQQIASQINTQNIESAELTIQDVKQLITQAQSKYAEREQSAKDYSLNFIAYVRFHLDSVSTVIHNMPHRTFIDQNRRDIARFRLRAVQEAANQLEQFVASEQFFQALSDAPHMQAALQDLLQYVELRPIDWDVFRASSQNATRVAAKPQTTLAKLQ